MSYCYMRTHWSLFGHANPNLLKICYVPFCCLIDFNARSEATTGKISSRAFGQTTTLGHSFKASSHDHFYP